MKRSSRPTSPTAPPANQDEAFVKVLTEKGKRQPPHPRPRLSCSPISPCEVVKLEVIKPDGEVVPVDVAANSKETIDDSQMAENIYDPNSKVLQVNIPELEIGDVVHSITRTTTIALDHPGRVRRRERIRRRPATSGT